MQLTEDAQGKELHYKQVLAWIYHNRHLDKGPILLIKSIELTNKLSFSWAASLALLLLLRELSFIAKEIAKYPYPL